MISLISIFGFHYLYFNAFIAEFNKLTSDFSIQIFCFLLCLFDSGLLVIYFSESLLIIIFSNYKVYFCSIILFVEANKNKIKVLFNLNKKMKLC